MSGPCRARAATRISVAMRLRQSFARMGWRISICRDWEAFESHGLIRRTAGGRHPSFRGYADHMQASQFQDALQDLIAFAGTGRTAVMCAEAKWWQCHRQLIADALVARGIDVRHIMSPGEAPRHQLTPFAAVEGVRVSYPALV